MNTFMNLVEERGGEGEGEGRREVGEEWEGREGEGMEWEMKYVVQVNRRMKQVAYLSRWYKWWNMCDTDKCSEGHNATIYIQQNTQWTHETEVLRAALKHCSTQYAHTYTHTYVPVHTSHLMRAHCFEDDEGALELHRSHR